MLKLSIVCLIFIISFCRLEDLITQAKADKIKSLAKTWQVVDPDKSIFKKMSKEEFAGKFAPTWPVNLGALPILGELEPVKELIELGKNNATNNTNSTRLLQNLDQVPAFFDGRDAWGKCIHSGRDQKDCSGCWAWGIANHLSDRFCIAGRDVIISVQDLLECVPGNKCCDGGSAENAYKFLTSTGAIDENCRPYDHNCNECRPSNCPHYKCERNTAFVTNNIERAKMEIFQSGPITAIYDVYDDFAYYKSGIYTKTSDEKIGAHSITLLGWGTENGINYWLCKNSWGDDWGDHSFFKIKMGECGIDTYMTSCKPLIEPF